MRIVLSNCPRGEAARIARELVESGDAACVSLAPVESVYRFQGQLCVDEEVTLFIKVGAGRVATLRERLRALHPYQLPEIVVLDVDTAASSSAYVDWVRAQSQGS